MNEVDGIQKAPLVEADAIEAIAPGVQVIPDAHRIEFIPNIGIVEGERAVLVVDTAMGHANGEAILGAAREVADGRKIIVTTTHFHPEHAYGARPFEHDCTYVANESQARELVEKGPGYTELFSTFGPGLAELLAGVELTPPDLTYDGRVRVDLGGRTVELIEVGPAHTRGDQLIWLPRERVLFTGDLVENAFFPILPDPDADGVAWLAVLDRITALAPTTVVGGHGAVGGPELVDAYRSYLEFVRDRVKELVAAGAERERILAMVEGEALSLFTGWGNTDWVKSAIESFVGVGHG